MRQVIILLIIISCLAGFTTAITALRNGKPVAIPAGQQRTGGDSAKGYQYLVTGDYVKGGIPYNLFVMGMGKEKDNFLGRDGLNKNLSHEYTAVTSSNGEVVVAPNCLQCHAQVFDGNLVMGLGNTFIDFSDDKKINVKNLRKVEQFLNVFPGKRAEAAENFIRVGKTIGPLLHTKVRGVNAADRLAAVLAAHRDPETFKWRDTPFLAVPEQVIPTDVPAWWLLKKKHAMFYNGFGRGDFGKFLMASNLLTVNDTSESAEVDSHMPDLLAYINSLTPPKYTREINIEVAKRGEQIFINNCSGCHGTYGSEAYYPNLLIPAETIGTDSMLYSSNYSNPQFIEWFNRSWFTKGDHPARLEPFNGYIAPPLDGIWITAPFLHNGSVPTLEALLNSKLRPTYWSRNFEKPVYDYEAVGWSYDSLGNGDRSGIYNTTFPGYGNMGHSFSDELTDEERKALIEYLKTL
jgi:mono/diheme cytochrome c family protein